MSNMYIYPPICVALCVAILCIILQWRAREGMDSSDCSDNPAECTAEGTALELQRVADFLSQGECDAIRRAALRKGLKRSTVLGEQQPSSTRTSSTVFLGEDDDPIVGRVFAKVSRLLGASRDRFEDIQVIRYHVGQKYDAHYDPCYRCQQDEKDLLREWTVLMYLNDDFQGGSTDFPLAGASVAPKRGMAAVFRSMVGGKIVRQSKHQSQPVTDGTKWAATVWVRPE